MEILCKKKKAGFGASTLDIDNKVIEFLIDNLFDKYIDQRYLISKDDLIKMLNNRTLVRFPYMLFSLLTFDKLAK